MSSDTHRLPPNSTSAALPTHFVATDLVGRVVAVRDRDFVAGSVDAKERFAYRRGLVFASAKLGRCAMRWTLPMLLWLQPCLLAAVPDPPQGVTMPQAAIHESRLDFHGDPLPQGAAARLGSVRLHHEGHIIALAFSPDGRAIVAACHDSKGLSLRFWETGTGKDLSRIYVDNTRDADGLAFTPDGKGLLLFCIHHNCTIAPRENYCVPFKAHEAMLTPMISLPMVGSWPLKSTLGPIT